MLVLGIIIGSAPHTALALKESPIVGDSRPPSATGVRAPVSGKFFYSVLWPGPGHDQQYTSIWVGSSRQWLRTWLSTTEHDLGVLTTECRSCLADGKYDLGTSGTARDLGRTDSEDVVLPLTEERTLLATTLTGRSMADRVELAQGAR